MSRATAYLEDVVEDVPRYTRRAWDRGTELSRNAADALPAPSPLAYVGLAALALALAGWAFAGSDLMRYLQMRRM